MDVRFLPAGDAALVVEFGNRVDRELSDRVLRLSRFVRAAKIPGVVETVPTFRSLMVVYDPLALDGATLIAAIKKVIDLPADEMTPAKMWRIPACYESNHAPDLPGVAERTGRTVDEIVHLHAGTDFHVYMIGFAPGHPYMGDLPDWLALPRRPDPRVRVPAGSIAIAGNMSVIYSMESPGGWHLIGATPIRLFNPKSGEPALLRAGDRVRFQPVTLAEFGAIRAAVEAGDYQLSSEVISA